MKKILLLVILTGLFSVVSGQGKFTDDRDGNVYRTVTISGMTWMKENLRFTGIEGAHFFDDDPDNVSEYGVLYEWKTAQSVCPGGWHLPTGDEFRRLSDHFGHDDTWGKGPSDPGSFNIQLGGHQDYEGIFSEIGESGYYWTSTEYDAENAEYFSYMLIIDRPVIDISRKSDVEEIHGTEKTNKYSVRCVKN